uniref:uncharacterized protein LOC101485037 isoform X2 n=2 Tax=Maylandia zebra TaxID=106582 RepID=UPI000D31DE13|nr:uncharacterized protein LOC101485037 isoform X2 [Maylandia zebra]
MSGLLLFVIFVISSPELQGQGQKPEMSVQHFNGEYVLITCSLPGSVKNDTRCNLYFGEASRPVLNPTVSKESRRKTKQRCCQFYVPVADFLKHLLLVQQKDASCDYSLESEPKSLSPRSDRYNMTDILAKECTMSPCTMTTAQLSLSNPSASNNTTPVTPPSEVPKLQKPESNHTSNKKTSAESRATTTKSTSTTATAILESESPKINKPSSIMFTESSLNKPSTLTSTTSVNSLSDSNKNDTTGKVEESLWNLAAAVTRNGIIMGMILLVLGLLILKRTVEENLNVQQMKNENSDIYHVYATISEETDAPDSQDTI